MSASKDALIRAVDALKELEGPQGATQEGLWPPLSIWKIRAGATRAKGATAKRQIMIRTRSMLTPALTIDQAMHDSAKDFQAAFIVAQLDPLRALPILRVPGTGRELELNDRQLHARRRVHEAIAALGGLRELRVARGRAAAERAGVGETPGVGRAASRSQGRLWHSDRGAWDVGGALGLR
jgi:hypothetical protein